MKDSGDGNKVRKEKNVARGRRRKHMEKRRKEGMIKMREQKGRKNNTKRSEVKS